MTSPGVLNKAPNMPGQARKGAAGRRGNEGEILELDSVGGLCAGFMILSNMDTLCVGKQDTPHSAL